MDKYTIMGISTTDGGVQKFSTDVMPDEVLEGMGAVFNAAETAQSTAETAQSTAETAKTTAETAKTTAEAAMPMAGGDATGPISVVRGAYKCTVGADKYAAYGFKISSVSNGAETEMSGFYANDLLFSQGSSQTYLSRDRLEINGDVTRMNCAVIAVNTATEGDATQITLKKNGANTTLGSDGVIDCPNHTLEIGGIRGVANKIGSGIILTSATPGSTKRFKITVDDTGTITATEVTN